jgi:hypothetical protein
LVQIDRTRNRWIVAGEGYKTFHDYDEACRFAYMTLCDRVGDAVYTLPPLPTSLYEDEARQLAKREIATSRGWWLETDPASKFGAYTKRVDPWLLTVKCKYGHLYPHSDTLLGVSVDAKQIVTRLKAMGFVPVQDGDDGANFVVPMTKLDVISAIVRPRRKPGGRR